MRTTRSWKDGGALLPQAFVLMLIATLVSADYPTIKPDAGGGEGGMTCSKCEVKEDSYKGPTWAYQCMQGHQGAKSEEVSCTGKSGCFRQLLVYDGKKVAGTGGCFDSAKKECIEKVTKAKFDDKGCIPETALEPPMLVDLKKECGIDEVAGGVTTPAPAARRRRDAAEGEAGIPKGIICVCEGSNCNNKANGLGRSAEDGMASSIKPLSAVWIGVISGMSMIGGSLFLKKRA